MALSDLAEKLAEYQARLRDGHADRITTSHVDAMIAKLEHKRDKVRARLEGGDTATSATERQRLEGKLAKAEDLIEQARWLRDRL
jgi:hypothetical protein